MFTLFQREDVKLEKQMEENGWTVIKKGVGDPYSFSKGEKRTWMCRKGWACAELINDHFKNHRYHPSLEEAMQKES